MMEESEDSSDNQPGCGGPGYDNDQEQDVIIIPITNRTQSAAGDNVISALTVV